MITVAFTSLFLLAVLKAGVIASLLKPWDPRTNPCQISLNNYHFNLCPLLDERHNAGQVDLVLHYETSTITSTVVYNISLNGPLRKSDAIPDHEQCVSGTWACLTTGKVNLGKDIRDVQAIPIVTEAPQSDLGQNSSVGHKDEDFGIYAELRELSEGKLPSLSLHMRGGYNVDLPQRVQINFECAESDNDVPKISGVRNGTHVLTWATKHACPRVYQTLSEDDGESDTPPGNEESVDPPEDVEEPPNQDLVLPPVPPNKNSPFTVTIIVCSGVALLGLGYVVIRPPATLRKRIREIRRARFLRSTRETKLLSWAAEEIEMLGNEEFEEDEMVNSRPLPDEQIPLQPNWSHTAIVGYGTVQ